MNGNVNEMEDGVFDFEGGWFEFVVKGEGLLELDDSLCKFGNYQKDEMKNE